jgi:hypothetical protein
MACMSLRTRRIRQLSLAAALGLVMSTRSFGEQLVVYEFDMTASASYTASYVDAEPANVYTSPIGGGQIITEPERLSIQDGALIFETDGPQSRLRLTFHSNLFTPLQPWRGLQLDSISSVISTNAPAPFRLECYRLYGGPDVYSSGYDSCGGRSGELDGVTAQEIHALLRPNLFQPGYRRGELYEVHVDILLLSPGELRVDQVVVSGTHVPEPTTMPLALLVIFLLGAFAKARNRSRIPPLPRRGDIRS